MKKTRKLVLRKETLRTLGDAALQRAAGGLDKTTVTTGINTQHCPSNGCFPGPSAVCSAADTCYCISYRCY